MRASILLLLWSLAGCSNLAVVLPRAEVGEPPLRTPEDAGPARTHIARSLTPFRLANGLEVVLLEDRTRPRFALDLRYEAWPRGEWTVGAGDLAPLCWTRAGDALEALQARGVVLQAGSGNRYEQLHSTGPAAELEALLVELTARLRTAPVLGANGPARLERATLVVAGDLPQDLRDKLERSLGSLPAPLPFPLRGPLESLSPERPPPVLWHQEVDAELTLLWPIADSPDVGAAEFDLLATILAEGPEARLERRVVLDQRFARQLLAGADASGACFHVTAVAACELDLAAVRPEIFAVLSELAGQGPSPAEFERARARAVARFLARMESLTARAAAVHAYLREYGVADGFQQDLARWSEATPEGVAAAARFLLTTPSQESLRLPEPRALTEGAASGARPASPGDAGADPGRPIAP